MRVMLDTNIFISMIFFPSAQTRELARRLTDSHQIVVCDYVVEELQSESSRQRGNSLTVSFWNFLLNWSILRKHWT